jgi:YbbR domain-containing protein
MGWLIRNWELKLGALGLATILYTGLVFSGSFTEGRQAGIAITRINQPNGAYVLTQDLPSVEVQYRQSRDSTSVGVDSFAATVDLSQYDMQKAGQPQRLAVQVRSLADGVTPLSFTPSHVNVTLDVLDQRTNVPVVIDTGPVPEGLALGQPKLSETSVSARGPRSILSQVVAAQAQIEIDASGIDFNHGVRLRPIDAAGKVIASVDLSPDTITVDITVTQQETTRTVPVEPRLVGTPRGGYQVGTVAITPPAVTLRGTPGDLAAITQIATEPLSIEGLAADRTFAAALVIPKTATLVGTAKTVSVRVVIAPAPATRTFLVGISCRNVASGETCLPQVGQISMTLAGTQPALAALKATDLSPTVDAAGLAPGKYNLAPAITLPNGITVVSFSPVQVPVVISGPSASPTAGG